MVAGRHLILLMVIWAADAAAAEAVRDALGVPDDEAVARATKIVKATYRVQYNEAVLPVQRIELAARLYRDALQTRDDPAGKYVMLVEARELASRAGDASLVRRAVTEISRSFGVAPGEMLLTGLAMAARSAPSAGALETVARCALRSAEEELAHDNHAGAVRFIAIAQSAASRSRGAMIATDVQLASAEVSWVGQETEAAQAALDAVALAQADAQAKFVVGRFKCLVKGDFERGVALLVEGADPTWQSIAQAERAAVDASAQAAVAAKWWDLAQGQAPRGRHHCRMRAAHWYRRALSHLTGLSRTTAQQRLEEFEQAMLRRQHLQPGLVAEIFAGEKFERALATRVDAQLDFEWPAAPGEGLPRDEFSIRWTGQLYAPLPGRYTLTIIANEGARVWIDEKPVIDFPEGTRKRNGKRETLTLAEGLHDLRIEFWDSGGLARIRLLWATPAGGEDEVIGERYLVH